MHVLHFGRRRFPICQPDPCSMGKVDGVAILRQYYKSMTV
jgi:hypothetical protein